MSEDASELETSTLSEGRVQTLCTDLEIKSMIHFTAG